MSIGADTARSGVTDAIVIGAGFAGLYTVHELAHNGFTVQAFEAGSGVGGTWYWNRYPGARCDVESLFYSYTFNRDLIDEWDWSERYATQPEILRYAEWVADRLDLRRHFSFNTRVESATFDETTSTWEISTGDGLRARAKYLITAVGCLSASSVPRFDGLDDFAGRLLHTGDWPRGTVDLTGQRVGVIGTGSSGIQAIPKIAEQAARLTVFQRTPNYSLPARNRPLYSDERIAAKKNHVEIREMVRKTALGQVIPFGHQRIGEVSSDIRQGILERCWQGGGSLLLASFSDNMTDLESNELVAQFVRKKIETIVDDPRTARTLTPTDYPIGAKRICIDTDYFATYNLPHVELVDVRRDPITRITATGLVTAQREFEFDTLVLATGYDAMTGPLTRIDVRGRARVSLAERWQEGAKTYLGLGVADFPNMFTITGPGSPSVLVNMFAAIEQHVEWIIGCLVHLREHGIEQIEAEPAAQDAWSEHVNDVAAQTIFVHAKSWYRGSNIDGKAEVFLPYPGGLIAYRDKCEQVAAAGYKGFTVRTRAAGTDPVGRDSGR